MLTSPRWEEFSFRHLGYAWERVLWHSSIGEPVHRFIPVGAMPKLHRDIANLVFYLYRQNPKTGNIDGPLGTGVFVSRKSARLNGEIHLYGVTNWHLANSAGASIIRINTQDGKSRFLELSPDDWRFIPGGDDLAAVDLTDEIQLTDNVMHYREDVFITQEVITQFEIGLGEDAFMLGMFAKQHGGEKNTPAARFGNLALLADKSAPIEQPNKMARPSHLVDMRSRTGFSGSPVSLYRVPYTNLENPNLYAASLLGDQGGYVIHGQAYPRKHWFVGLLGIHCSQYWDTVKVFKSSAEAEKFGEPIKEGDELDIQSGMLIVVPAWQVSKLLDLGVFETMRKERDDKRSAEYRKKASPEVAIDRPTTDLHPEGRERFNELLDAASRKQPRDGQT